MAKIPFNDKVNVKTCPCEGLGPMEPVVINVNAEPKLWRKKISHVESADLGCSGHPEKLLIF